MKNEPFTHANHTVRLIMFDGEQISKSSWVYGDNQHELFTRAIAAAPFWSAYFGNVDVVVELHNVIGFVVAYSPQEKRFLTQTDCWF